MMYGERLRQVRELSGLTQKDLAKEIFVPQPRLSNAERYDRALPEAAMAELSAVTGFPAAFFEASPGLNFMEEPVHFRAQTGASATQIRQARRTGEVLAEQALRMRALLRAPRVMLGPLIGLPPKQAAAEVRATLNLSQTDPLNALPLLLERKGVLVLGLPMPAFRRDAFSVWSQDVPILALLDTNAGDRQAWSCAHELGHLVLHPGLPTHREVEAEADEFAMHFLLPESTLRAEFPHAPTLQQFALLKRRWGVSIQSLIRAARRLEVIDGDRYTSLFRQISARGERLRERAAIPPVKPRGFRKMAEMLYGPTPAVGLSRDAVWGLAFTEEVLSRHATTEELPARRRTLGSESGSNVYELATRKMTAVK